jgi:hypothetical protein
MDFKKNKRDVISSGFFLFYRIFSSFLWNHALLDVPLTASFYDIFSHILRYDIIIKLAKNSFYSYEYPYGHQGAIRYETFMGNAFIDCVRFIYNMGHEADGNASCQFLDCFGGIVPSHVNPLLDSTVPVSYRRSAFAAAGSGGHQKKTFP